MVSNYHDTPLRVIQATTNLYESLLCYHLLFILIFLSFEFFCVFELIADPLTNFVSLFP